MISQNQFKERVNDLPKSIQSKTGQASYTNFRMEGDFLTFHRTVPKTNWRLNWKTLYQVYCNNQFINTTVIKKETDGRVNSPSLAILLAINCVDKNGNRIN